MILGIDEAGRGPWAGPLVVGAVVLGGVAIEGLTDSKKLTRKKRELLYDEITAKSAAYASGWVSAKELDIVGMSEALRTATRRAVEKIIVPYTEIIIDGTVNFLVDTGKSGYVRTMVKADLLIPSVSAASIIAKVERDRYMTELDKKHSCYGFKSHAGYGVARHRTAIEKLGVTDEHRLSFAPLIKYKTSFATESDTSLNRRRTKPFTTGTKLVTSKMIGNEAESIVAAHLEENGHTLLERNWRTKFCEIDIISQKHNTIYFVEVKHRRSDKAGDGLEYITAKKLKQMRFAAQLYAHNHRLSESDLRLAAVATTNDPPEVVQMVEIS